MVGPVRSVLTRPQASASQGKSSGTWLPLAGVAAFAVALGAYARYTVTHSESFTMDPVDLAVYRSGGLIVRHLQPLYNPHLASPLYGWTGYGDLHLQFTYPPFAAIAFALVSFNDSLGLILIPKNTNPAWYDWHGDQRWFPEYHWHGPALVVGNAYVLAGLAAFGALLATSLLLPAARKKEHHDEPGRSQPDQREYLRVPAA
jgi:hypothetical protein